MKVCRVHKIALREWEEAYNECRKECARLWNDLVATHRQARKEQREWPTQTSLEKEYKGKYSLHSQTIQALIQKFCSNIETTRTLCQSGNKGARYPYKEKSFFVCIWKGQAVKYEKGHLSLPMGRGRAPLRLKLREIQEKKIAQIELGYRELRITYKEDIPTPISLGEKVIGTDLGIIHTAFATDGSRSLAVVGRGLRSLNQGKNKKLAAFSHLLSKTRKGSRRRRRLQKGKRKFLRRYENQVRNFLHHAANAVLRFAVEEKAGTLVVGDIAQIAKGKKKKCPKRLNQENSNTQLGKFIEYLEYKGKGVGVSVVKINEAYTSQTCPVCVQRNKPRGRLYVCKNPHCKLVAIRDEVGALNHINKYQNKGKLLPGVFLPTNQVKYLRPVKLYKPKQSVVGALTWPSLPKRKVLPDKTSLADSLPDEAGSRLPSILPQMDSSGILVL